ncbi:hypothetical protein AMTR_s00119p00050210 [Amborella trichopoda]|uniref:Uncharacterized protein n=1 Tax=Amborella trichopoda TaxID=13333 RepID=W1NQV5_AMBTC|nr:hypothetical protein AMTR_s00119p00050210 [Amborella trichopoda]
MVPSTTSPPLFLPTTQWLEELGLTQSRERLTFCQIAILKKALIVDQLPCRGLPIPNGCAMCRVQQEKPMIISSTARWPKPFGQICFLCHQVSHRFQAFSSPPCPSAGLFFCGEW